MREVFKFSWNKKPKTFAMPGKVKDAFIVDSVCVMLGLAGFDFTKLKGDDFSFVVLSLGLVRLSYSRSPSFG